MANVETVKPDPSRTFPVRPGEEPWTPDEVTAQIDALETEVARLTADLAVADVELRRVGTRGCPRDATRTGTRDAGACTG